MANKRNRVSFVCPECGKDFEIIKCREEKSKRHFCSRNCRNKACGREKRLNKYPKVIGKCQFCGEKIIAKYMAMDKPNRKFCSYSCKTTWQNKNIPQTEEHKKQSSLRLKSLWKDKDFIERYRTSEHRALLAKLQSGENSHFWRGGLTDKNRRLRNSFLVKIWREKVFERDNYTCQSCGARSGNGYRVNLNADHIKSWSLYPELRFDVNNGRTLCWQCHKKTDNFGWKGSRVAYKTGSFINKLKESRQFLRPAKDRAVSLPC